MLLVSITETHTTKERQLRRRKSQILV